MRYVHNIVIYDERTDWFGSIGTQVCSCSKVLISEQNKDEKAFGYILLELEDPNEDAAPSIENSYIVCYSDADLNAAYDRCCEALISHPKTIDLRGLNAKLIESV